MRKLAILLLAFVTFAGFAQKKEVKSAEKLFKKGNITEAANMIKKACQLKDQADDKTKEKIMYLKAEIFAKLGGQNMANYETAIKTLSALQDFEKLSGKTKYAGKAKELKGKLTSEIAASAYKLYDSKNYLKAGKAFDLVLGLTNNDFYKFSAAVSYLLGENYEKSLPLLQELYKNKFTGQREIFTAIEKETGKRVQIADEKQGKLLVLAGTHKDLKKEKTKNLRPDVISNILFVYGKLGKDEEAIKFIEDAKNEDPNNIDLIIGEGNYYLKKGDNVKFAAAMQKAVNIDPNNKLYNYNLATALYQLEKYDEAKKYYEKTIELDPNFVDAYIGLSYIILAPEKRLTEELNKDEVLMNDALYNKYNNQRLDLYRQVLPTLEAALKVAPQNETVLVMLKKIYKDLEMNDKYKQVKETLKNVQGK